MNNIVEWLWSHVFWIFTTIALLVLGGIMLQIGQLNNFSHQSNEIVSRYGGLTPDCVTMLKNLSHKQFNDHFEITTVKYDDNHKAVYGAANTDFNRNQNTGDSDKVNFVPNRKGHYVKDGNKFVYATTSQLNGKYSGKKRYGFLGGYTMTKDGYYKTDAVTGHYIKTTYKQNDYGEDELDDDGKKIIVSQVPTMTTKYGGQIDYIIWYTLRLKVPFFPEMVLRLPNIQSVTSQVRQ